MSAVTVNVCTVITIIGNKLIIVNQVPDKLSYYQCHLSLSMYVGFQTINIHYIAHTCTVVVGNMMVQVRLRMILSKFSHSNQKCFQVVHCIIRDMTVCLTVCGYVNLRA